MRPDTLRKHAHPVPAARTRALPRNGRKARHLALAGLGGLLAALVLLGPKPVRAEGKLQVDRRCVLPTQLVRLDGALERTRTKLEANEPLTIVAIGSSSTEGYGASTPAHSYPAQLGNLLRGTLAEAPDIFISYRRSDAPAAAGRIANDLSEHFGARRVFLDVQGIAPSRAWDTTIDGALGACKVGVVVIGRQWLAPGSEGGPPRLQRSDDVVRREVAALLGQRKAVFPLLVEGAPLPDAQALPDELAALLRFQATSLDNAGWQAGLARLIREIEAVLRDAG